MGLLDLELGGGTLPGSGGTGTDAARLLRREGDYFARNAERMRYPAFRRQHLFVGSGVIEAGCNRLSNEFEDYWEARYARAA